MDDESKLYEYFRPTDREGIIQGFVPANPIQINPKSSVRRELKESAFNGRRDEDPLEHLQEFYEVCESQPVPDGVTKDQVRLHLFKFSLGKTAKDWLVCLPSGTIETWKDLEDKFLDRFFTEEQHKERRRAIIEFQQEKKESLHQSLERFKLYKRRCPNHMICAAELIHIFVNSMKTKQRMLLDASAGGSIKSKTPSEVEQLISDVKQMGEAYDGIMVQLPLPPHIDARRVAVEAIDPAKDVDGFLEWSKFQPCTPLGIMKYLEYCGYDVDGKNVVIIGRSDIVGKPLAKMMIDANATVTLCHSHTSTESLLKYMMNADLIVCAVGKAGFIKASDWNEVPIIDVGINFVDGKLVGDVSGFADNVTPVPGGVGLLTRCALLENVINTIEE